MNKEKKQYCVTARIYTWAYDEQEALENVVADLDYNCKSHDDNYIAGFIHPELSDVVEDNEP
jgi:hypothetical protein